MIRILFDAFHHMMPGHRIGPHLVVGGYQTNCGRYTPGDCFHPNGLTFTQAGLADQFEFRLLTAPYSDASLAEADILFAANPDYPLYEGSSPHRLTPEDVDALFRFLNRGGGVLLLINSFLSRPDFWEENFDLERVSPLLNRLGVRWDSNFMSDDKNLEVATSGRFRIAYGQGGRVLDAKLPPDVQPLLTRGDNVYGFQANVGRGRLVVLGDAGMTSNGLYCFPGFDNGPFLRDVCRLLTPPWCRQPVGSWDLQRFAHLSCAPSATGLNAEMFRAFRPSATWREDHHYRHLTWDEKPARLTRESLDHAFAVDPRKLADRAQSTVQLHWLRLDEERPGPSFPIQLQVHFSRGGINTDLHAIGRATAHKLPWEGFGNDVERFGVIGEIDQVDGVFDLKARLTAAGEVHSASWHQGQILFIRSAKSARHGYESVLSSANGVLLPCSES